jgi:hypothetical protein
VYGIEPGPDKRDLECDMKYCANITSGKNKIIKSVDNRNIYVKFLISVGHLPGFNIIFDPYYNFESRT